jgi:hypothetical protein
MNRYIYALNNPVRFVDVSGFSTQSSQAVLSANRSTTDSIHKNLIDADLGRLNDALEVALDVSKTAYKSILVKELLQAVRNGEVPSESVRSQLAALRTAGDSLTALNVILNSLSEIKPAGTEWRNFWAGLTNGDLSSLNADDWLDAFAHGTAAMTAVAWNTTTGGFDAVIKLSSGGEFTIRFTGNQVYDFAQKVAGP